MFEDNKESGILEINVGKDEEVIVPDFVSVLELVSNNELYFNKNIARAPIPKRPAALDITTSPTLVTVVVGSVLMSVKILTSSFKSLK